MRSGFLLVGILCLTAGNLHSGEKLEKRYGLEVNEDVYPQKKPEETLQSIVKAIAAKRLDYLMAHLADPLFVDKTVAEYKKQLLGKEEARALLAFDRLVDETNKHFQDDPLLIAELKQFVKEGDWKTDEKSAIASVKTIAGRNIFMHKLQNRWFLENKQK